jgi:hypothetical protein
MYVEDILELQKEARKFKYIVLKKIIGKYLMLKCIEDYKLG